MDLGRSIYSLSIPSIPSFFIKSSPNGLAIQVLLLIKQVSCVPFTFCKEGMIWMALLPPPMIPIRFPSKFCLSCLLELLRYQLERHSYFSSQAAECMTGICISLSPGISGQFMSFSIPRALMTTSALSRYVSPVTLFLTVMNLHFACQPLECTCERRETTYHFERS